MEKYKKLYKIDDKTIQANLIKELAEAKKDKNFVVLLNKLNISDKLACNYTSKLEKTNCEIQNCKNCKSLSACKNSVTGFVYYPKVLNDKLTFEYRACSYKKKNILKKKEDEEKRNTFPKEILNASFKDVDISDKKRAKVIKFLKNFLDNYTKGYQKGLFLHGNFGCGKSYLIACMINELKKKDVDVYMMYFQTMLTNLKKAMEENTFNELFSEIINTDVLVIDDLGAESITSWGRDEILGNILQYRMDNKLSTFITSNLNMEELEEHLSFSNFKSDVVKARRIIERIKQLMVDMEMISFNRRN